MRKKNHLRHPGIEPGSIAWEATMLTTTPIAQQRPKTVPGGELCRDNFFPQYKSCKNTVAYRSASHLSKRYPRRDSNPQSLAPETNALSIRPRGQLKRARRPTILPGALQEQQAVAGKAVGWPSGLRRQFQALVSSEAWVRIPLQSFLLLQNCLQRKFFGYRICLVPATVQLWSSWL